VGKGYSVFPKVIEIAHKGVITSDPAATLYEAVDMMVSRNIRDVIFTAADGGYAILTFRNLLELKQRSVDFSLPLNEFTDRRLNCVNGDDNILDIFNTLMEKRDHYFGVLDDLGSLCGIISYTDIIASVDPNLIIERKSIGEIIEKRPLLMAVPDAITEDVLFCLHEDEDALLVLEDDRPVGILTPRDAIRILNEGFDLKGPISEVMISPVDTISRHASIGEVINYLRVKAYRRAVVVDDSGHILGVVTLKDLAGLTYSYWVLMMQAHTNELNEIVGILDEKARRFEHVALTDVLTGVGNRRRMSQALEAEISRSRRYKSDTFSFILIDVDHFKQINDEHGHMKGDEALVAMCQRIGGMLRDSDMQARWGGDEFAVLLTMTGADMAMQVAERIADEIRAEGGLGLRLSASIGVGEYRQGESLKGFVHRIDQALYQAKGEGRNCVRRAV